LRRVHLSHVDIVCFKSFYKPGKGYNLFRILDTTRVTMRRKSC
jgi:hypothetical protein